MKKLHETKIEDLNKQPIIESSAKISEDGKWYVHKTIITDIRPACSKPRRKDKEKME